MRKKKSSMATKIVLIIFSFCFGVWCYVEGKNELEISVKPDLTRKCDERSATTIK